MEKVVFGLLALVLMVSCDNKNEYTITGIIKNTKVADGTEVYLKQINDDFRGLTSIDSAKVEGGKFVFTGPVQAGAEATLRFVEISTGDQQPMMGLVMLEGGKTELTVGDEEVTLNGTGSNVALAAHLTREAALNKKFNEMRDKLQATTDDALMKSINDEAEELSNKNLEETFALAKAHAKSELGQYIFVTNSHMFSLDQTKEIMSLIPEDAKKKTVFVGIAEKMAVLDATSVGKKFVDIKGLSPEGKELALSDFAGKGKLVLIDFWASWCPPCVADMPYLVAAYAKYKNQGFEIVGVSLDRANEPWVAKTKELNITWPQFSDLKFWDSELSKAYGISSIPHTVLIDKDGTIIARELHGADLDAKLGELLGK